MLRQRLALMTKANSTEQVLLLGQTESGRWRLYATTMSKIVSMFSIRIVGTLPQCDEAACEAEEEAFGISNNTVSDPETASHAHKFVLDMDGNGFSERFYRLLRSNSLVLKQALYEEWHDDRLIPWVHYIPVSASFEELPNS